GRDFFGIVAAGHGSGRPKRPRNGPRSVPFTTPSPLPSSAWPVAGLWERWDKGEEPLETYTFLTTEANELVAEYHAKKRTPVIPPPPDFGGWLTGRREEVEALSRPSPADRMAVAEISPAADK